MYVLKLSILFIYSVSYFEISSVKHVHFLQAGALKNRWEEEHIILKYKMQWTICFFKNKAEKWKVAACYPNISSGAKVYCLQQEFQWKQMSIKSDTIFKNTSLDYITPFI